MVKATISMLVLGLLAGEVRICSTTSPVTSTWSGLTHQIFLQKNEKKGEADDAQQGNKINHAQKMELRSQIYGSEQFPSCRA